MVAGSAGLTLTPHVTYADDTVGGADAPGEKSGPAGDETIEETDSTKCTFEFAADDAAHFYEITLDGYDEKFDKKMPTCVKMTDGPWNWTSCGALIMRQNNRTYVYLSYGKDDPYPPLLIAANPELQAEEEAGWTISNQDKLFNDPQPRATTFTRTDYIKYTFSYRDPSTGTRTNTILELHMEGNVDDTASQKLIVGFSDMDGTLTFYEYPRRKLPAIYKIASDVGILYPSPASSTGYPAIVFWLTNIGNKPTTYIEHDIAFYDLKGNKVTTNKTPRQTYTDVIATLANDMKYTPKDSSASFSGSQFLTATTIQKFPDDAVCCVVGIRPQKEEVLFTGSTYGIVFNPNYSHSDAADVGALEYKCGQLECDCKCWEEEATDLDKDLQTAKEEIKRLSSIAFNPPYHAQQMELRVIPIKQNIVLGTYSNLQLSLISQAGPAVTRGKVIRFGYSLTGVDRHVLPSATSVLLDIECLSHATERAFVYVDVDGTPEHPMRPFSIRKDIPRCVMCQINEQRHPRLFPVGPRRMPHVPSHLQFFE
jgi:hypothetical protein